jgi:hypothetical protein
VLEEGLATVASACHERHPKDRATVGAVLPRLCALDALTRFDSS